MIDFISTNNQASEQDVACARLLTSVILQAIHDASTMVTPLESRFRKNMLEETEESINFLFSDQSVFPLYAQLIGSSAESIRYALLNYKDSPFQKSFFYNQSHSKSLSRRHYFWVVSNAQQKSNKAGQKAPAGS